MAHAVSFQAPLRRPNRTTDNRLPQNPHQIKDHASLGAAASDLNRKPCFQETWAQKLGWLLSYFTDAGYQSYNHKYYVSRLSFLLRTFRLVANSSLGAAELPRKSPQMHASRAAVEVFGLGR
ncbi:hypothetical protein B0H14DRAFT_2568211 [Mycena olivaceomarginata]|nr:hypothetical protein B0H14DRAFT_2568211 [Mycena olivaceomarginata]